MDDTTLKNEGYFKKFLRLNRLPEVSTMNDEILDILTKNNLVEDYKKMLLYRDNWYVRITPENKRKVIEWIEKCFPTEAKAFSIGAYYGLEKGKLYTKLAKPSGCMALTTEQFYEMKI